MKSSALMPPPLSTGEDDDLKHTLAIKELLAIHALCINNFLNFELPTIEALDCAINAISSHDLTPAESLGAFTHHLSSKSLIPGHSGKLEKEDISIISSGF